jgi:DNA-directed RNA polymerase subunit alpha
MEHIHLPTAIDFQEGEQPNTGRLVVTPCHQGYGTTLGNSLRRVLLSSLPGAAVEFIKIDGVQHEFSAIDGVLEDVVQIILNCKQIAVKMYTDEPVILSLTKKGKGVITPADFDKNADVEFANPDMKIMTVTSSDKQINLEITVGKGSGYVPVSEKNTKDLPLGTIAIDSLYTPIRNVGYDVDLTRVGDITDYEKLIVNIETNGTITPKEAVSQATKILMDHFALLLDASTGEPDSSKRGEAELEYESGSDEKSEFKGSDDETAGSNEPEDKPKKRGRKKKINN